MTHLLFSPGMLPLTELENTLDLFKDTNKLTLIREKRSENKYAPYTSKYNIVIYEDFEIVCDVHLNKEMRKRYDHILKTILNDQRTFLIAERVNRFFGSKSLFSLTSVIEKIIFNSLSFYQANNIDSFLFQATPHNLHSWIMAKTAELLEINVRMIQTSPLPWRYWIVEGLDIQKPIFPNNVIVADFDTQLLNEYIKLNQADYKTALPEYEQKRLDSRKGKFWSWKKEIIDITKYPKRIFSIVTKRKLYNLYNSLSVKPDLSNKFIVFFLHFQPERTSMPEGLDFSNQWFIIRMISQTLPKEWKLIVKEHPSTYTNHLDYRYRNSDFYKDIVNLHNVELASLNYDTFQLIDASQGIATITGTVGMQALIRNKPVLVFGVASYRSLNDVYAITSMNDLLYAMEKIINSNNIPKNNFNELSYLNSISVSGILNNSEIKKTSFYNTENRIDGHVNLIKLFFQSILNNDIKKNN